MALRPNGGSNGGDDDDDDSSSSAAAAASAAAFALALAALRRRRRTAEGFMGSGGGASSWCDGVDADMAAAGADDDGRFACGRTPGARKKKNEQIKGLRMEQRMSDQE